MSYQCKVCSVLLWLQEFGFVHTHVLCISDLFIWTVMPTTITSNKVINAPLSKALAVLHDPPTLARLNPLVVAMVQDTRDPNLYTITDRMTMFGITVGRQWAYTAKFFFTEDGVDTDIEAAAGVKLKNQWRAKAQGDKVEVTETVTIEANAFVRPFVIYTLKTSHETLCIFGIMYFVHIFRTNTAEPYGAYHIALNVRPSDNPNLRPSSEWLNMGYWKNTNLFPDACEALALKVIKKARCVPGGHVLGDPDHPLDPLSSSPSFTSIIALDCAYHFASREEFLRQSFARLSPGGAIALGDLVISKPLHFGLRTILSTLLSVHPENMITPELYEQQLKTIGYANVRIEDISNNVFPGFRLFLCSRGGFWWIMQFMIGSWTRAGGRFVIVSASKAAYVTRDHVSNP
ncbi:hypothetical protein K439DRAFT_1344575 [Ramaria rubella]|nr:hypothetical protein K439DRAFT_1344575 [Ramaria rubella]